MSFRERIAFSISSCICKNNWSYILFRNIPKKSRRWSVAAANNTRDDWRFHWWKHSHTTHSHKSRHVRHKKHCFVRHARLTWRWKCRWNNNKKLNIDRIIPRSDIDDATANNKATYKASERDNEMDWFLIDMRMWVSSGINREPWVLTIAQSYCCTYELCRDKRSETNVSFSVKLS